MSLTPPQLQGPATKRQQLVAISAQLPIVFSGLSKNRPSQMDPPSSTSTSILRDRARPLIDEALESSRP